MDGNVLRGRCNSEPVVTVHDPLAASYAVDLVKLQDRR